MSRGAEYRTTDTDELAPYPDLNKIDFERFTDEVDSKESNWSLYVIVVGLAYFVVATWILPLISM